MWREPYWYRTAWVNTLVPRTRVLWNLGYLMIRPAGRPSPEVPRFGNLQVAQGRVPCKTITHEPKVPDLKRARTTTISDYLKWKILHTAFVREDSDCMLHSVRCTPRQLNDPLEARWRCDRRKWGNRDWCIMTNMSNLGRLQLFLPGGWREGGADHVDLTRISKVPKATEVLFSWGGVKLDSRL